MITDAQLKWPIVLDMKWQKLMPPFHYRISLSTWTAKPPSCLFSFIDDVGQSVDTCRLILVSPVFANAMLTSKLYTYMKILLYYFGYLR